MQTEAKPESEESVAASVGQSSLLQGPKFSTLIPNRIFVGGIPSNTTEQELKMFFSTYGTVKDAKIINDRSGLSKGSYGFVTFESVEMAEKIIKSESENLIFKDRKLNIGPAIRKQQVFPRADVASGLLFTQGSGVPYTFQNGMAFFSVPGQDYPMFSPQSAQYAAMMMPQAVYMPQPQYAYPQAALPQAAAAATLQPAAAQQVVTSQWQQQTAAAQSANPANATASQAWRWAGAPTPQSPQPAGVAPATYLYSPLNTSHEIMYFQAGAFTPNSTSDYSTDHSANSTGLMETSESDNSPSRSINQFSMESCMSPFNPGEHVVHMAQSYPHKLHAANISPLSGKAIYGTPMMQNPNGLKNGNPSGPPYTITRVIPTNTLMQTAISAPSKPNQPGDELMQSVNAVKNQQQYLEGAITANGHH